MPLRALARYLAPLALAIAVTGCGHMPLTSMVKLARVDLETSDPAQLRAAIKMPRTLRPRPNGMVLRIAVRVGNAPEESRDFLLRELSDPAELASEASASSHIFAYRIDDADIPRLIALRTELIAKKNSGRGGSITIGVQPQACQMGELPQGPIYFTTYLRTAETGDYVTLARDVDLRALAQARSLVDVIPRCAP